QLVADPAAISTQGHGLADLAIAQPLPDLALPGQLQQHAGTLAIDIGLDAGRASLLIQRQRSLFGSSFAGVAITDDQQRLVADPVAIAGQLYRLYETIDIGQARTVDLADAAAVECDAAAVVIANADGGLV